MITGFNTDVRYDQEVYHVQTEDLGPSNPTILSQVWLRGQILETIRTRYDDQAGQTDAELRKRLVAQHRAAIREILRGRHGGGDRDRPVAAEKPALIVSELDALRPGMRSSLLLLVRTESTCRPIARVMIRLFLVSKNSQPKKIHEGTTDGKGFHLAEFWVPPSPPDDAAVLAQATHVSGQAEAMIPLQRPRIAPSREAEPLPAERPVLVISDLESPRPGQRVSLLVLFRTQPSQRPISKADLRVNLADESGGTVEIYQGMTDSKGFNLAEFRMPATIAPQSSLLIQASSPIGVGEVQIQVADS